MTERFEIRTNSVRFADQRISYRLAGSGPALVLVKPHRAPKDYVQLRLLADRFTLLQINPLGYGASDRPRE
jgi:hypothetical protein